MKVGGVMATEDTISERLGRGKREIWIILCNQIIVYKSCLGEVKEIYSKWRQILSRKINSKFSIFIMQNKYNAGTSFPWFWKEYLGMTKVK